MTKDEFIDAAFYFMIGWSAAMLVSGIPPVGPLLPWWVYVGYIAITMLVLIGRRRAAI